MIELVLYLLYCQALVNESTLVLVCERLTGQISTILDTTKRSDDFRTRSVSVARILRVFPNLGTVWKNGGKEQQSKVCEKKIKNKIVSKQLFE